MLYFKWLGSKTIVFSLRAVGSTVAGGEGGIEAGAGAAAI